MKDRYVKKQNKNKLSTNGKKKKAALTPGENKKVRKDIVTAYNLPPT